MIAVFLFTVAEINILVFFKYWLHLSICEMKLNENQVDLCILAF